MNKHILFKMDHLANAGKCSNEELTANSNAALDAAKDAADIVADTSDLRDIGIAAVASIASYASYAFFPDSERLWIDEYFKITGEDRQLYINELENKMNKAKTITELNKINGAFDEGNVYECVHVNHRWFTVGAYYQCNGNGIIDNDSDVSTEGSLSKFKLVTPKEEAKAMRTPFNFNCRSALTYEVDKTMRIPFNLERAIAGDKVVDSDGSEYNQFSVIKTLDSTLINCYSVGGNCAKTYSEKAVNTLLFMVPKMGKGFINVDAGGGVGCYRTKLNADRFAGNERIMCIDLSQFPEGYGL